MENFYCYNIHLATICPRLVVSCTSSPLFGVAVITCSRHPLATVSSTSLFIMRLSCLSSEREVDGAQPFLQEPARLSGGVGWRRGLGGL